MFKSFFDWLVTTHPIANWIILIMLLALLADMAFLMNYLREKNK